MRVKARTQRGAFAAGDQIQLTDCKSRIYQAVLQPRGGIHSHLGSMSHEDLIGAPEGSVISAQGGTVQFALRPLLEDYTLAKKRGTPIVYSKDAAQVLISADVFLGARALDTEASLRALSYWLLRAIGPDDQLVPFEARPTSPKPPVRMSRSTSGRSPRRGAW